MSYFFAQRMSHCECIVAVESAWEVLNKLGNMALVLVQCPPLNYQSPFIRALKSCQQSLSKLQHVRNFLQHLPTHRLFHEITNSTLLLSQFERDVGESRVQGHMYLHCIEEDINSVSNYILQQSHQLEQTTEQLRTLSMALSLRLTFELHRNALPLTQAFDLKCLCINRSDCLTIKRSLFRMTRGNSFMEEMELEDILPYVKHPKLIQELQGFLKGKIACFIVYQRGSTLSRKIEKFIQSFACSRADIGLDKTEMERLKKRIYEGECVYGLTVENLDRYVERLYRPKNGSSVSWLVYMEAYIRKERQIYRVLSTTIPHTSLLQFKIYVATKELPLDIKMSQSSPPFMLQSCPNSNAAMKVVQEIVNTYGVPSYEEINPTVFYIVTFGFFIGVMFGDVGHMLLAIPLLILLKADVWFYSVVFFMGYCGLIYNQFFGLTLGIFGSCYQPETGTPIADCVCVFGIDPIWSVSTNGMQYINSLKMKTAVIIAVVHMMLGLFLKAINNMKQKNYSGFLLLTLPQIIFLTCTFLFMDFLIVFKWLTPFVPSNTAPSIISTMIAIFVGMANEKQGELLFFKGQRKDQKVLLVLAIICIPIMLFGQPIWQIYRRKNSASQIHREQGVQLVNYKQFNDVRSDNSEDAKSWEGREKESMNEIMVHQFIETIEYVLGTVSNTASYLRLWALSLAHAQLSEVIFQLILEGSLMGGYAQLVKLVIAFPFYLTVTFGVLICMDTLECFLHSLRLHWVEFQNKFYQGKGYLFLPYSFHTALHQ